MNQDPYAVLGVPQGADQATIRSAYRALMRRYHPDADPSAEAAEQARAINQAYAMLCDPMKRARVEGTPSSRSPLQFEPLEPQKPAKGWGARIGAAAAVAVALVAAMMVAYALVPGPDPVDRRDGKVITPRTAPLKPAIDVRAVAQPRKKAAAPVTMALSEASENPTVSALEEPKLAHAKVRQPRAISVKQIPVIARKDNARCPETLRRAERIMCGNENLASLDRQLALLYRQSWAAADDRKRAALVGTRQIFNDRRDECETPNCLTSAYVVRLKEISDIMGGRSRP